VTRIYQAPTDVRFVEANGLRFAIRERGEGPVVLLLHGFPDTPATFEHVMSPLAAQGYRAVAPFMRGYPPTDIPARDTDMVTLGRDALALIRALGETSAVVVGHDWGAVAAYAAASLEPVRVSKLVAIGIPHPGAMRPTLAALWGARHLLYLRSPGAPRRYAAGDFAHVQTLYRRWSPTWEVDEEVFEAVRNTFSAPGAFHAALGYYRQLPLLFPPKVFRVVLSMPTLLVAGAQDPALTLADYELARGRRFSGPFRVVGLAGGHFVHRESPEAFVDVLLDFLGPPA